mmetsp:Transcript_5205/g.10724  ORF Transcript_5205/g.10724 Transcript_5205/m.10724 type:complete len:209 (+) Transcript_5205:560-1186(+)
MINQMIAPCHLNCTEAILELSVWDMALWIANESVANSAIVILQGNFVGSVSVGIVRRNIRSMERISAVTVVGRTLGLGVCVSGRTPTIPIHKWKLKQSLLSVRRSKLILMLLHHYLTCLSILSHLTLRDSWRVNRPHRNPLGDLEYDSIGKMVITGKTVRKRDSGAWNAAETVQMAMIFKSKLVIFLAVKNSLPLAKPFAQLPTPITA